MNAAADHKLLNPRYLAATAPMPGNPDLWAALLDQSDNFAFKTVQEGKGGPFGAQLWLYNPKSDEYLLVGTPDHQEDSNAVVSKGLASAHAEAENLSPQNRLKLIEFLAANKDEGWQVVQVSSGESCQSCRSKQVLFAEELKQRGLIDGDGFHVVFKATYDQTKRDANFNDAPYDMSFRAINALGVLDTPERLFALESALQENPVTSDLIKTGGLIYNPVNMIGKDDISAMARKMFERVGEQPFALVVSKDGYILSHGLDTRDEANDGLNMTENTAIVSALHKAAQDKRKSGVFESWNLEGARLITNISDIGPQAYAETLWYNLSGIDVVKEYTGPTVDTLAMEMPGMTNREAFGLAMQDYDSDYAPIKVTFGGNSEDASIAHQLWAVQMRRESLLTRQAERLENLQGVRAGFLGASVIPMNINDVIESERISTNYDGKQAKPDSAPSLAP